MIIAAYILDAVGLGIWPAASVTLALLSGAMIAKIARCQAPGNFWVPGTIAIVATYLATLSPTLLPPGGGPDLTHHLALVDYIEQRLALVHDPDASRQLGEMAFYTPGLHILAASAAHLTRSAALFTIYPVVILTVALKSGVFALIVLRLLGKVDGRSPVLVMSFAMLLLADALTLDSFSRDSYLAQVASELFALAMWWAMLVWVERPSRWSAAVFGIFGAAAFLTWPPWVGPLVLAMGMAIATASSLRLRTRAAYAAVAVAPILAVAIIHSIGQLGAATIVGGSGAVSITRPVGVEWLVLGLAVIGLLIAAREYSSRSLVWISLALAMQAAALWLLARNQNAATPYMAIKMAYLAVYPVVAAAALAVNRISRRHAVIAWVIAAATLTFAVDDLREKRRQEPIVTPDLYAAGVWAREHFAPEQIDYLVANEYTAYWLHLAVLRNPRMSERTADNDLYRTEAAFARWIEDAGGANYAIARPSVLPSEIRERTRVLYQAGDAAVIERINSTPAAAGGSVGGSPSIGGS